MIQTSKLWKCIQPEIVKHCRQEKGTTISKIIKNSVPDKYSKHGAGVFSTICSKWALLFDCTSEGATASVFIWGGGGGGGGGAGLNRENCIDFEVFMTMEAIFREVIFFCRNKWMDL